jgi:transposase
MTKRQIFTKEFKLEAIRLLESSDKTGTEIARELGIRRNMLYKWLDEFKSKGIDAFKGSGRPITSDSTVNDLKRENERLREEVEILKKAAAYFARELK